MKLNHAKCLEVDPKEISNILELIKPHLTESRYQIVDSSFHTNGWLLEIIKNKTCSIERLQRMIFGKMNQSLKNLKNLANGLTSLRQEEPASNSLVVNPAQEESLSEENLEEVQNELSSIKESSLPDEKIVCKDMPLSELSLDKESSLGNNVSSDDNKTSSTAEQAENKLSEKIAPSPAAPIKPVKKEKKGHGRHPIDHYTISKITYIFPDLQPGDHCPGCKAGNVYLSEPAFILAITGRCSLESNLWCAMSVRCGTCGLIFRATFPKEAVTQPKADFAAKAVVCISKYQLGTPLYRLEAHQKLQGLPISDSEMWEMTESVALCLQPIHQTLMQIAATSELIHGDDTTSKVLELMEENVIIKKEQAENPKKGKEAPRVGIYTTALLAKQDDHKISIYVTGRNNAGENLDDLLDKRPKDLKRPIQACDASSSNKPERHETDVAKCFNHARHNFCEILESWPKECLTFVELMQTIFMNDRTTKGMTSEDRQKYHEQNSAPVMKKIKAYGDSLFEKKIAEPNSSLGKAIAYLNNHWEGLTLFLRDGLAPLTNNDNERDIKKFVLIRKNSLFYKTMHGALVGDILLSTINTCRLNDINSYEYLIAIQANEKAVHKNPEAWLPWNYTQNTTCSYVNASHIPKEEIYQKSPDGPPVIIPVSRPKPEKKPLRQHCKDFFRYLHPKK